MGPTTLPRFSLLGLALLVLLGPVRGDEKRVCHSFRNADLVYVIKVLARDLGKYVLVAPDVQGNVTLEVAYLTPERALRMALASCDPRYDQSVPRLEAGAHEMVGRPPIASEGLGQSVLFRPRQVGVPSTLLWGA